MANGGFLLRWHPADRWKFSWICHLGQKWFVLQVDVEQCGEEIFVWMLKFQEIAPYMSRIIVNKYILANCCLD